MNKVDLVFTCVAIEKVIETWNCSITYDSSKNVDDATGHVAALFRQIQNSVAFLPLISNQICKFDILVHCDRTTKTESAWEGIGLASIPFDYSTEILRTISSQVLFSTLLKRPKKKFH